MAWLKVVDALKAPVGSKATVKGWVRTRRDSKAGFSFVAVHDLKGKSSLYAAARFRYL